MGAAQLFSRADKAISAICLISVALAILNATRFHYHFLGMDPARALKLVFSVMIIVAIIMSYGRRDRDDIS
jgi:hypothetical protein